MGHSLSSIRQPSAVCTAWAARGASHLYLYLYPKALVLAKGDSF